MNDLKITIPCLIIMLSIIIIGCSNQKQLFISSTSFQQLFISSTSFPQKCILDCGSYNYSLILNTSTHDDRFMIPYPFSVEVNNVSCQTISCEAIPS